MENNSLKFDVDAVLALIPSMTGTRMNGVEVELTCPFCGKRKYGLNRENGLGHCWNAACPSDGKGYNIWQLYGAVYNLSNSEAIKELKKRLGMSDYTTTRSAETIPQRIVYERPKQANIASPAKLDKVYTAFLLELNLSEKNRLDLKSRGFDDETIEQCLFRTFPRKDEIDFYALCRRLISQGLTLEGVPGFYQCKNGSWCFVQVTKGIIMPTRDYKSRIIGLQIRKDDDLRVCDEDGKLEAKCTWFSSKNSRAGCGSSSPVHFACDWIWDVSSKSYTPYFKDTKRSVILTEGMMKAELIHQFQPQYNVISVAGVDNYKNLSATLPLLKEMEVEEIMLAFDMDYEKNENVDAAMKKTKQLIIKSGLKLWKSEKGTDHLRWNVNALVDGKTYPVLKGLDDFLAYKNLKIVPQIIKN